MGPSPLQQVDGSVSPVRAPAPVLVAAEKICKRFGAFTVLDGVDLELRSGEVVLLRGENGSGKTTLLNVLTGHIEPDSGVLTVGADGTPEQFRFPRPGWKELNPADHFTPEKLAREMIGRAWQDLRLFRNLTIKENLLVASPRQAGENPLWALLRPGLVRKQEAAHDQNVNAVLASLGIEALQARLPDGTSLGQAKRAAIARAIQAQARVMFLDEPLSGLDEIGVIQILEVLRSLVRSHNLTLVVVEHSWHIPRLLPLATRVWTMTNGRLTSESPEEVRTQIEANGMMEHLDHALKGRRRTVALLPGRADLSVFASNEHAGTEAVLEVTGWRVKRGSRPVMGGGDEGLGFKLRIGDVAVLRAPNGWGKSSFAESLMGLIPSSGGRVNLNSRDINARKPWERSLLGLKFVQARDRVFPTLSVREILRLSRVAGTAGLEDRLLDRRADQLSGGERQRVVLGCALEDPNATVLILDEPFNMLDQAGIAELLTQIANLRAAVLILVPTTPSRAD